MNTMFEKCAVAGDITKAIDRRGCWSVAITVIGGTSDTAVKLQTCETADGVFTDYKELIPASEASADQYKGFVLDLYGAGKFIKVVGATMATAVLGDCEADVKKIAITAGEIPSGAGATLYAWKDASNNIAYTTTATPEAEGSCYLSAVTGLTGNTIKAVAEGEITITISEEDVDFTRYSDGDIEL